MTALRFSKHKVKAAFVTLLVILTGSASVGAHELILGQIIVQHPWALPAKAGTSSRLYIAITNEGYSPVFFTGLKTPVANQTSIMFQSGPGEERSIEFVTVQPDETLNFATSHMWIDLRGLKRDLAPGDKFPAALEFGVGRQVLVVVSVGREHN